MPLKSRHLNRKNTELHAVIAKSNFLNIALSIVMVLISSFARATFFKTLPARTPIRNFFRGKVLSSFESKSSQRLSGFRLYSQDAALPDVLRDHRSTTIKNLSALLGEDDNKDSDEETIGKRLIEKMIAKFAINELLPKEAVERLLDYSLVFNKALPNVVSLGPMPSEAPDIVTICGDTHGQYADFIQIFSSEISSFPALGNRFIFNGDMVDRGDKGSEIVLLLMTMQLVYPHIVYALRGNHETAEMSRSYGFYSEVYKKYGVDTIDKFTELFQHFPLAAVVGKRVFVVHGGIGKRTHRMSIEDINALNRFAEPADNSPLMELLWSGKLLFH